MDESIGLIVNPERARLTDSAIAHVMHSDSRPERHEPDPSFDGSGSEASAANSSAASDSDAESEAPSSIVQAKPQRFQARPQRSARASQEEIVAEKTTLLFKLDRLEKAGEPVSKRYTLSDDIYELRTEVARLEKKRNLDKSIKFQRSLLVSFSSGIEFMNNRFDPVGANLDGWSENVHDNIDSYDDVFAELAEKYSTGSTMPPEIKLLMLIASSAFMCHLQNTMFKKAPGLETVMKANPGLARDVAAAAAKTMAQDLPAQGNPLGGGLASMLGGMFSSPPPPRQVPADIEEIFSEISAEDSVVQDVNEARANMSGGGSLVLDV